MMARCPRTCGCKAMLWLIDILYETLPW